jgi:ABC-2 type transport system permease protein
MKNLPTLTARELGSAFLSPVAYLLVIGTLAVAFLNWWDMLTELASPRFEFAGLENPMLRYIAFNLWFWISSLFLAPILTMRLLSEEKRSGTIEVLMTAPVTESEVVLSKYIAAMVVYALLWLPSIVYLWVLQRYGSAQFDVMPVLGIYIGVLTVGAMFVSIGLFFSSMTRNQLVAAMMCFACILLVFAIFVGSIYAEQRPAWSSWAPVLKFIGVFWHLQDFGLGKMNLEYLLLHVSVAVFMLFLTVKVLESSKWR